MVTTTNCCYCFSLKTGTLIIGILGISGSILSLIEDLVVVSVGTGDKKEDEEVDPEVREIMRRAELAVTIVTLLALLAELFFSVLLVYGAVREKPRFIKPWVYYSIVCLIVVTIALSVLIILCFIFDEIGSGISMLVLTILSTLVGAYLITVVNSFHRQLLGIDLPVMPVKV